MLILRGEQGVSMGLIQAWVSLRVIAFSSLIGGEVFLCREFI